MKFRALISDFGKSHLEKQFLPCLEKHGKCCHMLLSPAETYFVQTIDDADGMQVTARYANEEIYELNSAKIISRHKNLIGFKFELAHLRGALRAASNSEADSIEMKLAMKSKAINQACPDPQPKPFLCLTSKGMSSNMTHEIPIGQPLTAAELDELWSQKECAQLCPYYLDVQGEQIRLQALVDKLKSLDSCMTLITTKQGHLYLQVSAPSIQLTSEVQNLVVVPAYEKSERGLQGSASPGSRLRKAMQDEEGHLVVVQLKYFSRSLHSSQIAQPAKLLLGIAENGGYVHIMFAFYDPRTEDNYNDKIALSYTLPVRDED